MSPCSRRKPFAAFTIPFNVTGHPVIVIPADLDDAGLPVGVQIVGNKWDDYRLLQTAARLFEIAGQFRLPE